MKIDALNREKNYLNDSDFIKLRDYISENHSFINEGVIKNAIKTLFPIYGDDKSDKLRLFKRVLLYSPTIIKFIAEPKLDKKTLLNLAATWGVNVAANKLLGKVLNESKSLLNEIKNEYPNFNPLDGTTQNKKVEYYFKNSLISIFENNNCFFDENIIGFKKIKNKLNENVSNEDLRNLTYNVLDKDTLLLTNAMITKNFSSEVEESMDEIKFRVYNYLKNNRNSNIFNVIKTAYLETTNESLLLGDLYEFLKEDEIPKLQFSKNRVFLCEGYNWKYSVAKIDNYKYLLKKLPKIIGFNKEDIKKIYENSYDKNIYVKYKGKISSFNNNEFLEYENSEKNYDYIGNNKIKLFSINEDYVIPDSVESTYSAPPNIWNGPQITKRIDGVIKKLTPTDKEAFLGTIADYYINGNIPSNAYLDLNESITKFLNERGIKDYYEESDNDNQFEKELFQNKKNLFSIVEKIVNKDVYSHFKGEFLKKFSNSKEHSEQNYIKFIDKFFGKNTSVSNSIKNEMEFKKISESIKINENYNYKIDGFGYYKVKFLGENKKKKKFRLLENNSILELNEDDVNDKISEEIINDQIVEIISVDFIDIYRDEFDWFMYKIIYKINGEEKTKNIISTYKDLDTNVDSYQNYIKDKIKSEEQENE